MVVKGDIIKHTKFMDVCCLVRHVYPDNTLCIEWINQGYVESWPLRVGIEFIKLDTGWFKCDDTNVKCYRDSSWSKI